MMGTLGASSQTTAKPELGIKTGRFQSIYIDRINELRGFVPPGQKDVIYREVALQEKKWIVSMAKEYEEIMQAQEIVDQLDH